MATTGAVVVLHRLLAIAILVLGIAACDSTDTERRPPPPQAMTGEHIGYFCNMIVANHEGPKAQVILDNRDKALWFTSARDAVAFMRLPGEPKNVAAIYVTDMGAVDWAHPENTQEAWIEARDAWFVIESSKVGGMGAAEAVPFGNAVDADAFALEFGGRVVGYEDLPEDYVLSSQ